MKKKNHKTHILWIKPEKIQCVAAYLLHLWQGANKNNCAFSLRDESFPGIIFCANVRLLHDEVADIEVAQREEIHPRTMALTHPNLVSQ